MVNGQVVTAQSAREGFAAICGEANVSAIGSAIMVAPATANEVGEVLKLAAEQRLTVSPRGASTKAAWMGSKGAGVQLSSARMNTVTEHVWQDMTCTVGAGCTWSVMQAALAQHGQFVALDPLWPEKATVAGVVSANDSGVLRLAYGGLRDLLIGMTIVLVDGTVARSGGKVVKNVAGYDLQKLMCGAFGTLGFITEVTFRLHALPQSVRSFSIASASAKPLGDLLLKILDSHLSTKSVQVRTGGDGSALDVRLSALPQVLDAQAESLSAMAKSFGLQVTDASEDVWRARQSLFDGDHTLRFKATMLAAGIAEASETVARMGGVAVTQAAGIMFGAVDVSKAGEVAKLREQLRAAGGSLSLLGSLPAGEHDRWGIAPRTLHWMGELKRRFDPAGVLNPGCFSEEF